MIDEETDLSDGHDTNSGKELQDEYGSEEDLKKGIEKDDRLYIRRRQSRSENS